MNTIPNEVFENIIDQGDPQDIIKLCSTNKAYQEICDNYFIHKIKRSFKTPFSVYYELCEKLHLVDLNTKEVFTGNMQKLINIVMDKTNIRQNREVGFFRDLIDEYAREVFTTREMNDKDLGELIDEFDDDELFLNYHIDSNSTKNSLILQLQIEDFRKKQFVIIFPKSYTFESCKNTLTNNIRKFCYKLINQKPLPRDLFYKYTDDKAQFDDGVL